MTFLNPLVLVGLIAAAIPLIIHLFNFRRPKRIDFSSLAFLRELQKSTMQRVRIKQWLLLVLRTLAIACLILAFARPTLTSEMTATFGGRASSSIAVVVDNSLSMTLRDAQGAYLEQAKEMAAGLIDQMEPGDEVFVVSTASEMEGTPAPFRNRGPALEALEEIETRPGAESAARTLYRAAGWLEEASNLNREIFFISDLQRSTWLDSLETRAPDGIRTVLLPIGRRTYPNVAVTDVRVTSRIIEVQQPTQVEATLVSYAGERIEDYVASLYLGGERVAQATVDLEPDVAARAVFTVTPQERGWLAGLVQIEDDAFTHDNVRHFTLHVPEERRLLIVRGEGQRTDYVELAFSSRLTRDRIAFDVHTIPETDLPATSLGGYDAVVLVGPRDLSSGEVALLSRYVEAGGGLLLFPSEGARASDYNALLEQLGGGTFSGFSGSLSSGGVVATFERVDLEHTLFEGVFDRPGPEEDTRVETPELYFAMNYTPRSASEQTLIQLSNGMPFLQELRHGNGAAFLLAVAPDPRWSDLPLRGLFVPLLYRSVFYLSSGEPGQGDDLIVGQPGEVRLTGLAEGASVRLVSPVGEEFTPEQRSLFGAVLLQTDQTLRTPGVYDVRVENRLVRRVALNLDTSESNLQVLTPEEAAATLEEATGLPVRVLEPGELGAVGVIEALEAERTGVELWNVFLLLALLFLTAEMLVAMQWRPEAVAA